MADPVQGLEWLELAAAAYTGDSVYEAAHVLAMFYETGARGVPKDEEKAQFFRAKHEEVTSQDGDESSE